MSTVMNGHREEETTTTTHSRPHGGHILPMLSFSASTPTEEENPLDNNPAIAIDVTLWEQPEDGHASVGTETYSNDDNGNDEGINPETVPLIDVNRDVVLVDGPTGGDTEELSENAPLLAGGRGMCSDDSGVGGLGIPMNMPRSSDDQEDRMDTKDKATSIADLRDVASQLVSEVLNQAQVQATKPKDEAATAASATEGGEGGVKGKTAAQNLASPASAHAERLFRGGPWYVQMGRVFSTFVSRICPCRSPSKP